jgi:UDP-glucuronate 4-epimerase
MSTVVVTGAAGFIGSRVAERLLCEGRNVIGIDNLNDAYDTRLKHWRLEQLRSHERFAFHRLDVSDAAGINGIFAEAGEIAGVINLAARAGVRQSVENPWVYVDTNVTGTLNLLEACRHFSVPKFVLASTSSLYGAHNPVPFREDADTNGPLSPYAATKKAAESMCYSYHHLYGIDVTVLRYFTVYGPAGRPDMSGFRFVQWIAEGKPVVVFGDGSQSRDFTYVDDIARGTIAALKPFGYATFNLGSDRPVVLMEMIRTVESKLGRQANLVFEPAHPADVPATWADITSARERLGWEPQTTFDDGITHLVNWYLANREWTRELVTT